jgi:chemotaxis protein MotB
MPKYTWVIASVLSVAVLTGILGFSLLSKNREVAQAQAALAQAQEALTRAQQAVNEANGKLEESQTKADELRKEKESAAQTHKSLEEEMRAALESKDITISQLQGKLTVNILDRVLFDSGEAELRPDGMTVLRKVAAVLAQHPGLRVHVIGHTDNVPIRKRFPSNWELSTARAVSAVRFLTETAGVDPHRVGALGYGEFRPLADNSTAEGRAKNRRIAITVLSDELVGADSVAMAETNSPAPPIPNLTPTPESASATLSSEAHK